MCELVKVIVGEICDLLAHVMHYLEIEFQHIRPALTSNVHSILMSCRGNIHLAIAYLAEVSVTAETVKSFIPKFTNIPDKLSIKRNDNNNSLCVCVILFKFKNYV